jgi:hypothetical protein
LISATARMRAVSNVCMAHSLISGLAFIASLNSASSSGAWARRSALIMNRFMQDAQRARVLAVIVADGF